MYQMHSFVLQPTASPVWNFSSVEGGDHPHEKIAGQKGKKKADE